MYKPLPNSLTIKSSGINGLGLFAKEFIAELENATGAIDAYKIYLNIFPRVKINAALHDFDQTPTYAPIKYAGHGGGEFIFVKDWSTNQVIVTRIWLKA